jgi:uncharacterized protein YhfF
MKVKFGGTLKEQNELAEKVLTGEKVATSSLYYLQVIGESTPTYVGDCWQIFNGTNKKYCEVKVRKVKNVRFGKISEEFAREEGDGSLKVWKEIHKTYYDNILNQYNENLTSDTIIECVWFERIR